MIHSFKIRSLARDWPSLPDIVRIYIVHHEICHMAGIVGEGEADRCAVDTMRSGGYLGGRQLAELAAWVAEHLGAERAISILGER